MVIGRSTVLALGLSASSFFTIEPARAQDGVGKGDSNTIIVTARRREERLQDVPISVTVFNQEQIDKRNIVNTTDLVNYTPSLSSNNRFGADNASYSIRGFTQELRTTASVGVFFADVVSQRAGQTAVTAGDGAGPGAFFDLENVQVLKGPQGTLFGRNTTGGAVMLSPRKPTDRFEGYVEGSLGNYNLRRIQAVLNVPIAENVRLRVGVDHDRRDGYQHVLSGLGPNRLGKIDYVSGRASLAIDLSDSLENYTIGSFTKSRGNSLLEALYNCAPVPTPAANLSNAVQVLTARACAEQFARNRYGFYDTASQVSDPISSMNSWQVINTTTWTASDELKIKNIVAYGEMDTRLRSQLFGTDYRIPTGYPVLVGVPFVFSNVNPAGGGKLTDQRNLVEELQFQGSVGGDKVVWQAGAYYERSSPKSFVGTTGDSIIYCPNGGDQSFDPNKLICQDPVSAAAFFGLSPIGNLVVTRQDIAYRNAAAYGQATYKFNSQFSVTGGIRYTWDKTDGRVSQLRYIRFPTGAPGTAAVTRCAKTGSPGHPVTLPDCLQTFSQKSKAPTWLIDVDFHPVPDVLLYANYKRGYRQGSVIPIAPDGFESYGPESVDAYEIGMKTSFNGAVRGYLNLAAFYNDLSNQQIQVGVNSSTGAASNTTIIANAGKSTIQGIEVDARLIPIDRLTFDIGYTYLKTKLKSFNPPVLPAGSPYDRVFATAEAGDPLTFTPEHKLVINATYDLPVPEKIGTLSIGATYIYTSSQVATKSSPFGVMPSFSLVNANLNWSKIGGSPIDVSLFVTNLLNEEYASFIGGTYSFLGGESRIPGEPRMFGMRMRYNFGG